MHTFTETQNQHLRRLRFAIEQQDIEAFRTHAEGFTADQLQNNGFNHAVRQCFTEGVQHLIEKGCSPDRGVPVSALNELEKFLGENRWLQKQPNAEATWNLLVSQPGHRNGIGLQGGTALDNALKSGMDERFVLPLIAKTTDFPVARDGRHALTYAMTPRYSDAVRNSIAEQAPELVTLQRTGVELAHEAARLRMEHRDAPNPMAGLEWLAHVNPAAFQVHERADQTPMHALCEAYWRSNTIQLQGELNPFPFPKDAMELLQRMGNDLNTPDMNLLTPPMLALEAKKGWGTHIQRMDAEEAKTVQVLLDAGMNPLLRDGNGETIHFRTARAGLPETTEVLLQRIQEYGAVRPNDRGLMPSDCTSDAMVQRVFQKYEGQRAVMTERYALAESLEQVSSGVPTVSTSRQRVRL